MSTFRTLLSLASLGVVAAQYNQLQNLQQQGADQAAYQELMQEVLEQIRDDIFKFRQAAKEIVELSESEPRIAAGAMTMLADQLDRSGITPELLPDLKDKEYTADTLRMIHKERERLLGQISEVERSEIIDLVHITAELPDFSYYLAYYDQVGEYRLLEQKQKKYKSQAGCVGGANMTIALIGVGVTGLTVLMLICAVVSTGEGLLWLLGSIVTLVVLIIAASKITNDRSNAAAIDKQMAVITADLDLNYYKGLEIRLGTSIERVQEMYDAAAQQIDRFFGEYTGLISG